MTDRKIIILAGPNGAGKTTFARAFLQAEAQLPRFINADLIAAGLAPFAPETATIKAARLMLQEIDECVRRGESFAVEMTLAGRGYFRYIAHWRAQGYRVSLYFLRLPNAEAAIARVAERVRQGGHNIPEAVIRRRFAAGGANFEQDYRAAVDGWALYDNTGTVPMLLEWSQESERQEDVSMATSADLRGSLAAIRRAARAARQLAIETNTALVRVQDGVVVRFGAEQLRAELAVEETESDALPGPT